MRRIAGVAVVIFTACSICSHAAEHQGPRRAARAARLQGRITLDGKLDEPGWQKAPENAGFFKVGLPDPKPVPDEARTSFRVVYDEDAIYFGIKCMEPHMDKLVVKAAREHDAAMWSDDDVEIFLDPVGDRNEYYQFAVNTEGTRTDLYMIEGGNTGRGGWSGEWQARVHKDKGFWSVEIRIPFGVFHNRPSTEWKKTWIFSISRTRKPKPSFYSQFSPGNRYHDITNFGTLGPIEFARDRYIVYPGNTSFHLSPVDDGFSLTGEIELENRGRQPLTGNLSMNVLARKAKGATIPVDLAPGTRSTVKIPGAFIKEQGRLPAVFVLKATDGSEPLNFRVRQWMRYVPLVLRLLQPNYRNNIYATQKIDTIRGEVRLGVPLSRVRGLIMHVGLSSDLRLPRGTEMKINNPVIPFTLSAADLPVGRYIVRAEIRRMKPKKPKGGLAYDILAEAELVMRKLAPAPTVEARVDAEGNLLVDGRPVFIRGWYGSMQYRVSRASFPQSQVPRTTNFIMGAREFDAFNAGLYTLKGITRLPNMERKTDREVEGALRANIRAAIASVRGNSKVIGYYISDEPECRGLSDYSLQKVYEFLRDEDPYRFCMVVSRAPAKYMKACDVMCPHPYLSPSVYDDGTRKFANYILGIHNTISEAVKANDGSKAVWCMPQTFSYGFSSRYARNPNFLESRWFAHTAIACGAKGMVPFIFCSYWSHWENRVAMKYVFEDLAFLAPAWCAPGGNVKVDCDNPQVDVTAKALTPKGRREGHVFVVAAIQSYAGGKATFKVPALAKGRHRTLLVLRENRVVPVNPDGSFTDTFGRLGVHVYTSQQVLPALKSLEEIMDEIQAPFRRAAAEGNLLAQNGVRWSLGKTRSFGAPNQELIDGIIDAAAWMPGSPADKECEITFAKPVTFSRVVFYSPTVRDAELQVMSGDKWKTIHRWKNQLLYRFEYKGKPNTTSALRIRVTANRRDYNWVLCEITEMGVYK